MSDWVFAIGKIGVLNVCAPILVAYLTTLLLDRRKRKASIPHLSIRTFTHAELKNNKNYLERFTDIVCVYFEEHCSMDNISGNEIRVSLRYEILDVAELLSNQEKISIISVNAANEKNALVLTEIIDKQYARHKIDEAKVQEIEFSNGNSCFVFEARDNPLSIKGIFGQDSIIYDFSGRKRGVLRARTQKFRKV